MAKEFVIQTAESEWNGKPLLSITGGNFRPFRMSLAKVKAILTSLDALREFEAKYSQTPKDLEKTC